MVDNNVVIKFKGDSSGLNTATGDAVRSLDSVVNLATEAGSAIAGFFDSTVNEFAEFERRINRTDALFEATSGSARITTTEINQFADALGDAALTSQEEVLRASNALQTFRAVSGDTFFRTLTAAQDLSEVLGSDLQGATIQLAKALEDPVLGLTALRRSGVSFTEDQRELVKSLVETGDLLEAQNIILSQVEGQLGGAGVAAAQGFAGAVDTLGENLNDFNRTAGETASTVFTPLVNGAAEVLDTFNSLPAGVQKALFGITGFIGILGTATAAVVAFSVANQQLQVVQTAVLLRTQALTSAKALYAAATGTATAAQAKFATSLIATAGAVAGLAGALAVIALNVDTFSKVTSGANETAASVNNVEDALLALQEVQAQVAGSSEALSQSSADLVQINQDRINENLGATQQFLDGIRGVLPGIATAQEAALSRQSVAFGDLITAVDGALDSYDRFNAETANEAEFNAQLGAIEASIRALEQQKPVTEAAAIAQRQYLESLKAARDELTEFSSAQDAEVETIEQAVERIQVASESAASAIEQSITNQTRAVRQQQLDGVLTAEQAQDQITQLQIQGGRDRIEALQIELARTKQLRMGEDSDELATRERELTKELGDLQLGLVEQQISAQEELQSREEERIEEIKKAEEEAKKERIEEIKKAEEEAKKEQLKSIEERSIAEQNLSEQRIQGLEQATQAQENITRALDNQASLIRARQGLLQSISDIRDYEFSIAAELTNSELEKAKIEAEAAEARRASLEVSQAIERQIFELGVRRQQTELQIEAIRLRAADAANQAEQARAQAAIEQARVEGASDTQIRSLQLGLNATRIEAQAIASQREGLGQQATLLALTSELERNTLAIQQDQQARAAFDETFIADVRVGEERIRDRFSDRGSERADRAAEEFRESAFEPYREAVLDSARQLSQDRESILREFSGSLAREAFPTQSLVQPFNRQPALPGQSQDQKPAQFGDVIINQNNNVDVRGNSPGAVEQDFERVALDTVDQVATKLQELVQ